MRRRWIKTPWQKIRRAALRGTGVHLTARDTDSLLSDGAIESVADQDDIAEQEWRESLKAERLSREEKDASE